MLCFEILEIFIDVQEHCVVFHCIFPVEPASAVVSAHDGKAKQV